MKLGSIRMAFVIMLSVGAFLSGPAFAAPTPPASLVRAAYSLARVVIHVPGMTCRNHSCATAVYMALIRLPGVMGVGVDESTQDVTVQYISAKTQPSAFLTAISNAGFPGRIIRHGKA